MSPSQYTTPLTVTLNRVQRIVLRDFLLQAQQQPNIYYATLKELRGGRAAEIAFDDLGRIVDALGPFGQQLVTALRMAEADRAVAP